MESEDIFGRHFWIMETGDKFRRYIWIMGTGVIFGIMETGNIFFIGWRLHMNHNYCELKSPSGPQRPWIFCFIILPDDNCFAIEVQRKIVGHCGHSMPLFLCIYCS